jgi:hypothetical protein
VVESRLVGEEVSVVRVNVIVVAVVVVVFLRVLPAASDTESVRNRDPNDDANDRRTSQSSLAGPHAAIFPLRTHLDSFAVFLPQFPMARPATISPSSESEAK